MNAASAPRQTTHPALRWAKWIGTALVLAVTLGYLGLILAGYQPMTMITGSMQKSIPVGSLVVSHSVSPDSLRVGDVISFQKPIGAPGLDTHRIVSITIENKQRLYQTKGDSNSLVDPWVLRFDPGMDAHRMAFHVPYLGNALLFARSPIGRILLIGYVCFVLFFSIFKAVEAVKQKKLEDRRLQVLRATGQPPAVRHGHEGHEGSEGTLGGRRVGVERPRVRAADGSGEMPLPVYRHFTDRDPLARIVPERMLAGVSWWRYGRTGEPVGIEVDKAARAVSKLAISRTFTQRTREALGELMARRLDDVRLAVLMLDGIELKGRTNIVALGITSDGVKIPLGLWEASTENATVATALLSDLVARGLDTTQGVLCVLDGSKALRKAVRDVLGERAPVQRCHRHEERNILDHLPERDRAGVRRRLRQAWDDPEHGRALGRLEQLAGELKRSHPGAAASLREGMAETLTLTRLGITGPLTRTLASTNPIELMIECVQRTARNVKRWQSSEIALCWTAAGMLEAERQFRRIIGYQQLAALAVAIERDLAVLVPTEEVVTLTSA